VAYLFDTSMLAEVLRSSPPRSLIRRLTTVPTKDRWTSVVTVSQLLVAARRAQQPRVMQTVVQLVASVRVAPFDLASAQTYAKLRASVAPDIDADDVMIAAIAITQGFVVVTRRPRVFAPFHQLRVEDWTNL
jgi:tRNA(fMet)-specific endonuclease VapC